MAVFEGFDQPRDNFYKLPNEWFDLLTSIRRGDIRPQDAGDDWQIPRIIAPLKATEYVIKHTWGWGRKHAIRLSRSEIQHGRKGKAGRRLDAGTGLGNSTLTRGIELARDLGLLTVEEDNDDQGRQKRYYLPRLKLADEANESETIEPEGIIPDVTANYFVVPKVWTDICRDIHSEITILTVEFFFRHTWGWQGNDPDRPYWLDADDVTSGRRYRSDKRRGERYDNGIGYSLRRVRDALEEGVQRGLLVWRYIEDGPIIGYDEQGRAVRPKEYALRRPFMLPHLDATGQYCPQDISGEETDGSGGRVDDSGRGTDESGQGRDNSGWGSDESGQGWDSSGGGRDSSGQGSDNSGGRSCEDTHIKTSNQQDTSPQSTQGETPSATTRPPPENAPGADTPSAAAAVVRVDDDQRNQNQAIIFFREETGNDTLGPPRRLTIDQAAGTVLTAAGAWYWSEADLAGQDRAEREVFTPSEVGAQIALDTRLLGADRAISNGQAIPLAEIARQLTDDKRELVPPMIHHSLWEFLDLPAPDPARPTVTRRRETLNQLQVQAQAWGDPHLVTALGELGISARDAEHLIGKHGAGMVGGWLQSLRASPGNARSLAGVLISSLRAGKAPPGGQMSGAQTPPSPAAGGDGHNDQVEAVLNRIGGLLANLTGELQALTRLRPDPRVTALEAALRQAQGILSG